MWFEGGVLEHKLLCARELLADGELHRPGRSAPVAHQHTTRVREQGREGTRSLQASEKPENLFCIENIRKQTMLKPFARCGSLTSCSVSVCGLEVFKHESDQLKADLRPFQFLTVALLFVFGHYILDANDPSTIITQIIS